jgi:hypothetical protein
MQRLSRSTAWAALALVPASILCSADPARDTEVVAISCRASEDYQRTRLPDGSFSPETYAFGEGGRYFSTMHDKSLEKMSFTSVARTVAVPLAEQAYVPSHDPEKTKLLIMVYWGMTPGIGNASGSMAYGALQATQPINLTVNRNLGGPPPPGVSNQAMGRSRLGTELDPVQTGQLGAQVQAMTLIRLENEARDRANSEKAGILGYDTDMQRTAGLEITPMRFRHERLVDELESNRYFVVLLAYDFQLLWKEKKRKLVWESRFSISERGNLFDRELESMARAASRYFGRNTDGLARQDIPRGLVEMDEIKFLGVEPGK